VSPASPLHDDGDVSVVIVAYRARDALAACLRSFEEHRPARVGQVVVVDNTAPPERPSPADEFAWIDYDAVGENLHFRRGVNRGAERATRPYLLILNPDTVLMDSDSVARLAEVLDQDPSVGFAGPRMQGDDGLLAPQGERLAGLMYLFSLKSYLNAIWPGNPVVRRHTRVTAARTRSGRVETVSAGALLCRLAEFRRVGGFDGRATIYWEEHELARKLRRLGLHGYYDADAFVYHSWRKGGTEHDGSSSQRYFDEAMALYYREYVGRIGALAFAGLDAWQRGVRRLRR
jgi:hypothetical protein